MLPLEEKRKFRRILYSKTTLFILCLAVFFVARATWGVYQKEKESSQNLAITERRFDELNKRNDYLSGEIKKLSSPGGVEEEIRQKFRVAKAGEQMAVIVDSTAPAPSITDDSGNGWWARLWAWITR
ncbi:MAG: septum formation initiator family protein [Candidatus Pacebacteria bacterium]|nr:septum formation initiator family protein [Candidatus Paceibacterota bacterium]MDD5357447.1 septum formation initiator family protein [Candidatus Paceibacterota bacterium]